MMMMTRQCVTAGVRSSSTPRVAARTTTTTTSRTYASATSARLGHALWLKQGAMVRGGMAVAAAGLTTGGVVLLTLGGGGGGLAKNTTSAEQQQQQQPESASSSSSSSSPIDQLSDFFGGLFSGSPKTETKGSSAGGSDNDDTNDNDNTDNSQTQTNTANNKDGTTDEPCQGGPGKRVVVNLEPEVVDALPVMSLDQVRLCNGLDHGGDPRLLVTYQGIVYDVTQFVHDHPGGQALVETAAGFDLEHFFANYTVHGQTNKAAHWLAPLAVAKLSEADANLARTSTTPHVHVARRQRLLTQTRRHMMLIATTLPVWMTLRCVIGWIGWFLPPLGRLLARTMPVTVPGFSPGAEPLQTNKETSYKVAIIGGGVAGCGAAWALKQSGFDVTLFEARAHISGNARTFDWQFPNQRTVESCVSVTAWPPILYKNYTLLLEHLGIDTVHQPLSWFLHSKVPGYEGTLWQADPAVYDGSLRQVFAKDFQRYQRVVHFSKVVTSFFTLQWAPWRWNDATSMYDTHQGIGLLNPLNIVPLYSLFKLVGGTEAWWNIVFTPQYTASFLVDELRPFPAVFGPIMEFQIPLIPNKHNSWQGSSKRSDQDCNITTCVTWKEAGKGIRKAFDLMVEDVAVKENTRVRHVQVLPNGQKRVYDEYDQFLDVDRVVFACPANAVGNIHKGHHQVPFANTILSTPVYADDHHPSAGHMHAVMHSDGTVIPSQYRDDCLKRASNFVEITQEPDGSLNIENQYNFGVQTPGPGVYDLPLDQKPVMLISHALGHGKHIDPALVRGTGNHARAHPLYSGWNVMAQLSLRLIQGRDGIYYCSNWTTPGNCHDMSLLSGFICAHAIGAKYPFRHDKEATKDFHRLRDLMGF